MPLRSIVGTLFLLLAGVPALAQTTIRVPADKPTIQSAIDFAANGDTILVSPGTYYENIDFKAKGIILTSTDGAEATIIDGRNLGQVIKIKDVTGTPVVDGFTLINGRGSINDQSGGGVLVSFSSPLIQNNIIRSNGGCSGTGIFSYFSTPWIRNNTIRENRLTTCSGGRGGAISIGGASPGLSQITDNLIVNNSSDAAGAIMINAASQLSIRNNTISGNNARYEGGAFQIFNNSNVEFIQNLIFDNSAGREGGAGYILGSSGTIYFLNNTFSNNTSVAGISLYLRGYLENTTLTNNILLAADGQTSVHCIADSSFRSPTLLSNNVYSVGGAAYSGCPGFGVTNVSVDPKFRGDSTSPYQLDPTSPLVDAGLTSAPSLPTSDRIGETRIVDGNNDSQAWVDMGALEYSVTTGSFSAGTLAFGNQLVLTSSPVQNVVLTNTGSFRLRIATIVLSPDYSQTNDCPLPAGLAPGTSCTFNLAFRPLARGARPGSLVLTANTTTSLVVNLSGFGLSGVPNFAPSSLSFGPQLFGTVSAQQTVTLSNQGDAPLQIQNIIPSPDFGVTSDCPASLGAGASCSLSISFSPLQRGPRGGTIQLVSDALGSPHSFSLTGAGQGANPVFSPASLTFPAQTIGIASGEIITTLSNTGDVPLSVLGISVVGPYTQNHDCPSTLAVSATCQIRVIFTPTAQGIQSGSIVLNSHAPSSPQVVPLSGIGGAPFAWINWMTLFVTPQVIGFPSPPQLMFIGNTGDLPLVVDSVNVTGDYSIVSNACNVPVAPGGGCGITLVFTPTQAGTRTGTITATYVGPSSPATGELSGTGVLMALVPATLNFVTAPATVSETQIARLVNGGPAVSITGVAIAGNFQQTNDCPAVLLSQSECSFSITFNPPAYGGSNGSLTVTTSAGPHALALSGWAPNPTLELPKTQINFGDHVVGLTSAARRIYLFNTGQVRADFISISATGPFSQTNTCAPSLAALQDCYVDIIFSPTAPGAATGQLSITSNASPPSRTVSLSGTGLTTFSAPSLQRLDPGGALVGSGSLTVKAVGSNFNAGSVIQIDGQSLATVFLNDEELQATVAAAQFTELRSIQFKVLNTTDGAGLSSPVEFVTYQTIPVEANDIIYDPFTRTIMASVRSGAAMHPSTISWVNPESGSVDFALGVTDPGKLAISTSAKSLAVASNGGGNVTRLSVPGHVSNLDFHLGPDTTVHGYNRDFVVDEIEFIPGSETAMAVSRQHPGSSPRHAGVAIYDDDVARPSQTGLWNLTDSIVFGDSPSILYALDNGTTECGLRRLAVSASGVAVQNITRDIICGFLVTTATDGSRIYGSNGQIFDPATSASPGTFNLDQVVGDPFSFTVATDKQHARSFFLKRTYRPDTFSVLSFDNTNFQPLGRLFFPVLSDTWKDGNYSYYYPFYAYSNAGSLIRWGTDGLAFRATIGGTSQIILFRTSLLHPTGNTNVPITLSAVSPQTITTGISNTVLTLTGSGFVIGMRVLWDGAERTTIFVNASTLQANIPAADLAQAANITLTVVPFDSETPLATTNVSVQGPNVGTSIPSGGDIFSNPLQVGRRSAPVVETIENNTAVPLPVNSITLTGEGDFTAAPDCPTVLGAGEACDIAITFNALAPGPRRATLSVVLGKQTTIIPLTATGYDLQLSLERAKRPARSAETNSSSTLAVLATVKVVGIPLSQVRLGCVSTSPGTSCSASYAAEGVSGDGNARVSLHRPGRLTKTGPHSVTLTATVGDHTQTLPIQFNVPAVSATPRKPQRLSRSR